MLTNLDPIPLVPTLDADRSRPFYEHTLGLPFVSDDGFAVVFDVNGRTLRLTRVRELTPHPFSILGWHVPDIAATVRGLAEKGVVFERYAQFDQDELGVWAAPDGSAKVAWFHDPDGNLLSVVEIL